MPSPVLHFVCKHSCFAVFSVYKDLFPLCDTFSVRIAHISHNRHNRQWCTFFRPAYFFPQCFFGVDIGLVSLLLMHTQTWPTPLYLYTQYMQRLISGSRQYCYTLFLMLKDTLCTFILTQLYNKICRLKES